MHLLLQQLGELVESEAAGPLEQDELAPQATECLAGDEVLHVGKEHLVVDTDFGGLRRHLLPDADELADAPLDGQVGHLCIERLGRDAALEDVTQYERLPQRGALRLELRAVAAAHEVEGDVEGVDV